MKLGKLFTALSYSELSSLSLSNEANGTIRDEDIEKVIVHVNDALTTIFTKFNIYQKELVIETLDWKTKYYLRKEFAVYGGADSNETYKYIKDTPNNVYNGKLVKVLNVYNEVGKEMPLNDVNHYASILTPEQDLVLINFPSNNNAYGIVYQSLHEELLYLDNIEDTLNQDINIPFVLEKTLKTLIAYNIYAGMSGQEFSAKSQNLFTIYEMQCKNIEDENLVGGVNISTSTKFDYRGFV